MNVLEKAHPKVKAFVEACGAKVMNLDGFDRLIGGMPQSKRVVAMHHSGFYNVSHDVIVINIETPNSIAILDRTILHELGHWSGRSDRMQRKVLVNTEKGISYTETDLDSEEIIAEMIAFQIGSELKLVTPEWQAKSENYIASFRNASVYGAREHVKQAVWFLFKIATHKLQAG
jgi:antirestriction protein ArdC